MDAAGQQNLIDIGSGIQPSRATTLTAVAALTEVPLDITFSSNPPTPIATQTISNGTVPTVAELGQFAANVELWMAAVHADLTALRARVLASQAAMVGNGFASQ